MWPTNYTKGREGVRRWQKRWLSPFLLFFSSLFSSTMAKKVAVPFSSLDDGKKGGCPLFFSPLFFSEKLARETSTRYYLARKRIVEGTNGTEPPTVEGSLFRFSCIQVPGTIYVPFKSERHCATPGVLVKGEELFVSRGYRR